MARHHLSSGRLIGLRSSLALVMILSLLVSLASFPSAMAEIRGTISPASPQLEYDAGPFFVANPSAQSGGLICNAVLPCDDYPLTVSVPAGYAQSHSIRVNVAWPTAAADFDLYILDSNGAEVTSAASSADPEVAIFAAAPGSYTVRVVPFAPAGQSIHATISLFEQPADPGPGTGIAPRYHTYVAPADLGNDAGEPSIGSNWNTGRALFISALQMLRISFDDCSSPAVATWEDKSSPFSATTLDPILFTDCKTGRTQVSQLAGKLSQTSFTDDDGDTWLPSQGNGVNSGVDHQTVGGGPFASVGITATGTYTHAVYYCSQDIATAYCALSRDGGLTYGLAIPTYNLLDCSGLHGHIQVAPDGTAYLPNKGCGSNQAVVVSQDNGQTWAIRRVPDSVAGDTDPAVGIGADGTVYFGYQDGSGRAKIAVSRDRGLTWSNSYDVGAQQGVKNSVFPAVVAGDSNRAAYAFIGTTTPGNYQDTANFAGEWHLYVAHTFDGGASWITVDTTPNDPVQRGSICTGGTTCGNDRNLLDFMGITVDRQGRVMVGYADGCIGSCVQSPPNSFSAKATIARLSSGQRLFAASDVVEPGVPAAPLLTGQRSTESVNLAWGVPDNGGSPITGYKIYRSTTPGGQTLLDTIPGNRTTYQDLSALPNTTYYYRITAVNAIGEGAFCREVMITGTPTVVETACLTPGITVGEDATGDATDTQPSHDVEKISIAEPYFNDGSQKLVFSLKVASLATLPPSTLWPIYFKDANAVSYRVAMETNAAGAVTFTSKAGAAAAIPADPASTYAADGTITIVVPTANLGNLVAGNQIINIYTRITVGVFVPDNMPDTGFETSPFSYRLVGNAACAPNAAPTAALTINPQTGFKPLLVTLDASASSDPDSSDTIQSYMFSFGDGSAPVTQISPVLSHTYTQPGIFEARVRVIDSRGLSSVNIASEYVLVEDPFIYLPLLFRP